MKGILKILGIIRLIMVIGQTAIQTNDGRIFKALGLNQPFRGLRLRANKLVLLLWTIVGIEEQAKNQILILVASWHCTVVINSLMVHFGSCLDSALACCIFK